MCLVGDIINTLDDCDLLEKVVNMSNVLEHNDVTVSIKVQQFRCRYANMYIIITKQNTSEDVKTSLSEK